MQISTNYSLDQYRIIDWTNSQMFGGPIPYVSLIQYDMINRTNTIWLFEPISYKFTTCLVNSNLFEVKCCKNNLQLLLVGCDRADTCWCLTARRCCLFRSSCCWLFGICCCLIESSFCLIGDRVCLISSSCFFIGSNGCLIGSSCSSGWLIILFRWLSISVRALKGNLV